MAIAGYSLGDVFHHILDTIGIVISDIAFYNIACLLFDCKGSFGWRGTTRFWRLSYCRK